MFICFCFTGVSDAMHSGSGCHVRGVGPERLAQGEYRGHPVDLRVAEDRAERLQTDLGGKCHTHLASVKYICANFTFMGPCVVNVFKHNQQDATLHNDIYYCKLYMFQADLTAVRSSKSPTNTRCCVYRFELLMMGGGTA